MTPLPVLFHLDGASLPGARGGSPLYDVPPDHLPALLALGLLPLGALAIWVAAGRSRRAARLRDGYRTLPPVHRLAAWLLSATAVIHLALLGHHDGLLGVLMIVDGLLLGLAALLLLTGRRWRPLAGLLLVGSLAGWMAVTVDGHAPDQVGLVTKLIELAALAIVVTPVSGARVRGWLGTTAVLLTAVLISASAWVGAFVAAGSGHHGDGEAAPGMVQPVVADRSATPAEQLAANVLWREVAASLRRYEDPAAALADGYLVGAISGLDTHVPNPAYAADGHVLDPMRPEHLIYAASPAGPVLLGAMFEMPRDAGPAPAFGGPLTVWHGHEQICWSLTGLTGLVSPFGGCPLGSVTIASTGEMIHAWTAAGAPVHWGDLDDAWRSAYVARVAAARMAGRAGTTAAR